MASLISFWLFFALSLLQPQQRQFLASKPWQDWLLDGVSLGIQGAIIPPAAIVISNQFLLLDYSPLAT